MTSIGTFDLQLRFVPVESLLVHEEDDPYRVKRLVRALKRERRLRNPIIVSKLENKGDTYVVLDGATRTSALREMNMRHALVQVVNYFSDSVELKVWNHVLAGFPSHRLLAELALIDELVVHDTSTKTARQKLKDREIIACISLINGQEMAIMCEGDINHQANCLCRLVSVYRGKAEVHRTSQVDIPTLLKQYPDLTALISFPAFSPPEIIDIATNGNKVPMGVTRHIISGRALGLGVSLDMLSDPRSLEEKNAWLTDKIRQLLRANKVRFYQEPVIIFDE